MKVYKGFNKDLTCRDFQYEIGKTYEEDSADLCSSGFHACEAPLDVFNYYAPGSGSRYCEAELEGVTKQQDSDSKRCGTKITIGAEIGIPGLVKAHVEYVKERVKESVEKGDSEAATAGGYGAATAGECGAATAGECGAATAGGYGAATAGECGAATAGECGAATSRGTSSVGAYGVAIARATEPKVRGGLGAVLVLVEEPSTNYEIKSWKVIVIDGEQYKPDTFYTLIDGEVKEAEG